MIMMLPVANAVENAVPEPVTIGLPFATLTLPVRFWGVDGIVTMLPAANCVRKAVPVPVTVGLPFVTDTVPCRSCNGR